MKRSILALEGARKSFGEVEAVRGIDLDLEKGRLLVLLGPSRSGKTTLLRMIAGLERPTEGRIVLEGDDVTRKRLAARDVACLLSGDTLYPHLSLRENIELPLRMGGEGQGARAQAEKVAAAFGLQKRLHEKPRQLSSADLTRAAIAKAMVRRARLLLMDEPLAGLTPPLREELRERIREHQQDTRTTLVFATEDQTEALAIADEVAVLVDGELQQRGTPIEVYRQPVNLLVAQLVGAAMNFIAGQVAAGPSFRSATGQLQLPLRQHLPVRVGQEVSLGVRPEGMEARPSQDGMKLPVLKWEPRGSYNLVHLDSGRGHLRMRTEPKVRPSEGDVLSLHLIEHETHLFDQRSGVRLGTLAEEPERR
ncbi:MAG: ABC transporter ATP-binding protein [Planctomycetota bacterium]